MKLKRLLTTILAISIFFSFQSLQVHAESGDKELQEQIEKIQLENQKKEKEVLNYSYEELKKLVKENKAYLKVDDINNTYHLHIFDKGKETIKEVTKKEAVDLGLLETSEKVSVDKKENVTKEVQNLNLDVRENNEKIQDTLLFKVLIGLIFILAIIVIIYYVNSKKVKPNTKE